MHDISLFAVLIRVYHLYEKMKFKSPLYRRLHLGHRLWEGFRYIETAILSSGVFSSSVVYVYDLGLLDVFLVIKVTAEKVRFIEMST